MHLNCPSDSMAYSCEHMRYNIAPNYYCLFAYCLNATSTVVHLSLQNWFIDAQSHLGRGSLTVLCHQLPLILLTTGVPDGVMSSVAPDSADNLRLAEL